MSGSLGEEPFLLSTAPATRSQERLAAGIVLMLLAALVVTAPLARLPLAGTEPLMPAYAAAVLVVELLTAAMLLALFAVQRSRAVLVLAAGYLGSGLLVVPWVLSFPGVFAAMGMEPGLQGTATIAALRRLGFPLAVLAYALLKDRPPGAAEGPARPAILWTVGGSVAVVASAAWLILANDALLPAFMLDDRSVAAAWRYVPAMAVGLYLAGLVLLWRRRRSVLDLWLMVVLATLLIEILLLSYLAAGLRLSFGWWVGRLCGLTSASIVLIVLLAETTTLYARLARAAAAERRAREARLTAMEAFSASIAHEVNQPLASMVTNAAAALRWLARDRPDLDETQAALGRIVADGHRAGKLVEGIRTMFKTGAQERVPLLVDQVIDTVLERSRADLRASRVTLRRRRGEQLPPVIGNPHQLQQVVGNLVTNALEALGPVADRPRLLDVATTLDRAGDVLITVADNGSGLGELDRERIFEPFVSTKPDGMGMGLMFCRAIAEAHGGRLWAEASEPSGAVFRLVLPACRLAGGTHVAAGAAAAGANGGQP